ncbi:BTAD domain-containing putative transcriptional regulator [Actinophytocola sp.]|uniref:BTAD domain-containing putative transcriptional regulator n=1 Tax=Actinophytocola sp. TaxID=1872138 RepID=UPI002ED63771
MRVAMLGPLSVRAEDGSPVEVTGARLRTLLILLALDPGHVVSTARLVDGVWGEEPPAEAANALQALVSRLRRTGLTVESRPTGYHLALDPDDVDVHRFERLAAHGRATLATDPVTTSATLREALALWRGPALADAATTAFAQAPIARLNELRLAATGDRIEAELEHSSGLVPELEALVAEYPLHERFAGLLMKALARTGRVADALAVYARTKTALADELGADPSADLAALHLDLLRGQHATQGDRQRTNLRSGLTSFVGRDEDLARVTAMVDESRLVTLTGPGGSGKTRLATEAGRALVDRLPDGVWFVELASVGDGADVAPAVLTALGMRAQVLASSSRAIGEPVEAPLDRLAAALSHRALLLVMDNCEHLIGAAAVVADRLLGECPRLRILATSREPLGITGETLWPVDPLTLPPADANPPTALTFSAVRLLADRALAVRPGFTVDEKTTPSVVHICRALDGMPLAIELAAARLRTMSLDQLATRLGDRFRLLTGGSRMALPRHQTLRAVVDWSWDLLDDGERTLLRRLAIFAGGATLEAVEQVCAGPDLAAERVLDLLTALVDKSLVLVVGDRYRLLETIKAYGRERLDEAGETERVLDAFIDWFSRLAATAEPHLRRAEQLEWLAVLEADHDNLHAAVRAAIATGAAVPAARLLANAGWYWWLHGHKTEGAELAAEVVAMTGEVPPADRALALGLAAMLAIDGIYDQQRAIMWFTEAVELVESEGVRDHPLLRMILALNDVLQTYGRPTDSLRMYLSDVLFTDEDPWVLGVARVMRAHASLNAGQLHAEAEDDFRVGLAAFRSIGERWGMSFSLCSLADLVAWRGDFATAIRYYEEANELFSALVTNDDLVRYRLRLANLHMHLGDRDRAAEALALAEQDAERSGMLESYAGVTHARGDFARLAGDFEESRRQLELAVEMSKATYYRWTKPVAPQFAALIEGSRGYLAAATGELADAVTHHSEALELALESHDAPIVAHILVGVADLALRRGKPYEAATVLGASEGVRGAKDLSILDHAQIEDAARAELGEDVFTEAYAKGVATTLETLRALTDEVLAA